MDTETIDQATLTKLAEAGVVCSAHVAGQEGGWGNGARKTPAR